MDEGHFYHRVCVGSGLKALERVAHLIDMAAKAGTADAVLVQEPAKGMFSAGDQIDCAIGFTLRLALPPAGRVVEEADELVSPDALRTRVLAAKAQLLALGFEDFSGANERRIRHRAGFADLDQSVEDYVFDFALPNLNFHLTAAYIALKQAGVPLGKADFDGLHVYPEDFTF